MATKNISRTVIEGGRTSYNKEDRHTSNRLYRAKTRRFSKSIAGLIDPDDAGPTPERRNIPKAFADKLGAMHRWLGKQVGKKWDNVFSDLVHRFDRRTVAGNHVIKDHLLQSVIRNPTDAEHLRNLGGFRRNNYYVDECGILKQQPINPRVRSGFLYYRYEKIQKWAANRLVMDYGVSLFWMVPDRIEWTKCGFRSGYFVNGEVHWSTGGTRCYRKHRFVPSLEQVYDVSKMSSHSREKLVRKVDFFKGIYRELFYRQTEQRECLKGAGKYRQGPRLSIKDVEMWNSLAGYAQSDLLHVGSVKRK